MTKSRRSFLKTAITGAVGITAAKQVYSNDNRSYSRIIGANDRIRVAIAGLGRRRGAFVESFILPESNVELVYLCDVMESQLDRAAQEYSKSIKNKLKLEKDVRKILDDRSIDVLMVAAPDHWHAPMAWMAMEAGKHVYLEKPCSHNPRESEILLNCQQKYGKLVQMGTQQRSSDVTIEIINKIHSGIIGDVYKAAAYYSASRGELPVPEKKSVPKGLDWDLFQGPAPRKPYIHNIWDYDWHWYGWDYGTAEAGNNGTHEIDIARWALQVKYPERVFVEAAKRHFPNDGWSMYDTMEASFIFPDKKVIQWDGKSRNGYKTYNHGRGVIIYGTEGTVCSSRSEGYKVFDRGGKLLKEVKEDLTESGMALGGKGGMTTRHVVNFYNAIRSKEELRAPLVEAVFSQHLAHLANIASRTNNSLEVSTETGHIFNRNAMSLWGREYEPGWEPSEIF